MQPQRDMSRVFDKLRRLPPERVGEVEDFIDFLDHRTDERRLTRIAQGIAEPILQDIWNNEDDAVYDDLPTGDIHRGAATDS